LTTPKKKRQSKEENTSWRRKENSNPEEIFSSYYSLDHLKKETEEVKEALTIT